ncbi:unnamed protein product [Haemonchus placei]|uniref:Uncharacterized protein n=1 Tax=Haemonchus placei TaxID=6290 RepID=A0A0N4WMT4_HAEPC|nr:unnamed protein product [Haemonchus placei]
MSHTRFADVRFNFYALEIQASLCGDPRSHPLLRDALSEFRHVDMERNTSKSYACIRRTRNKVGADSVFEWKFIPPSSHFQLRLVPFKSQFTPGGVGECAMSLKYFSVSGLAANPTC